MKRGFRCSRLCPVRPPCKSCIRNQLVVQVTCNAVADDNSGCNEWYVDPIPGHDISGNPIPGAATGRLVFFDCSSCPKPKGGGRSTDDGNRGDYYFRFHFRLTRP
jgi:hypothetical protein